MLTDALGRLRAVVEPDPVGTASVLEKGTDVLHTST